MGREHETDIIPKMTDGPTGTCGKMLNMTSPGVTQITAYEKSPHMSEWLLSKDKKKYLQEHGEKEPSCTVVGNVNWCNHY